MANHAGSIGFVSEQSVYSLMNRHIELEVAPACQAMDIGLLTYSPLAGGLLGGKIEKGETGRRSFSPKNFSSYESLCHKTGISPADLALAWVANQPLVTAPIVGPRTMAQLESSVKAIEIKLEKDVLDELDELFPGPGGPALEAYSSVIAC